MPKQSNGKKRQPPSVERQLALTIRALLDAMKAEDRGPDELEALDTAVTDAHAILKTHGYENLQSIPSRVKAIQAEIQDATEKGEWDKLARLGAGMIRAEKGLPPLPEKKPRKPRAKKIVTPSTETAPKERKPRKKKGEIAADSALRDDRKPETVETADSGISLPEIVY